jgi:type II secretory pathway component GspD/PulD (secretin)
MSSGKAVLVGSVLSMILVGGIPVYAQTGSNQTKPEDNHTNNSASMDAVTLDVRNAPLRDVLAQLFQQAKVDFSIDSGVTGLVTLHLSDQPLDTALRLVLRSSRDPLTYTHDGGIYIVKPRPLEPPPRVAPPVRETAVAVSAVSDKHYAVIELNYIDPADLAQVLGIRLVPFNVRGRGFGGFGQTGTGFLGSAGTLGNGAVGGNGNSILSSGGTSGGGAQGHNP